MTLNKDVLIELMQKVRESGIRELIVTHDRVEIRTGEPIAAGRVLPATSAPAPVPAAAAGPLAADAPAAPAADAAPGKTAEAVAAPIPGMVFVAPGQDLNQRPLPGPGAAVREGDVVALVEAMKMFNEIYAPAAGVIDRIAAGNKTMVKVGDPILFIRPD